MWHSDSVHSTQLSPVCIICCNYNNAESRSLVMQWTPSEDTDSFETSTFSGRPPVPKKKRNKLEQYLYDRFGDMFDNPQHIYNTDEDLDKIFRAAGCGEENLSELRRKLDEAHDRIMSTSGVGLSLIGLCPFSIHCFSDFDYHVVQTWRYQVRHRI